MLEDLQFQPIPIFRGVIFSAETSVFPGYQKPKIYFSKKQPKTLHTVTRNIQSGNTEFSIEEGYGKG